MVAVWWFKLNRNIVSNTNAIKNLICLYWQPIRWTLNFRRSCHWKKHTPLEKHCRSKSKSFQKLKGHLFIWTLNVSINQSTRYSEGYQTLSPHVLLISIPYPSWLVLLCFYVLYVPAFSFCPLKKAIYFQSDQIISFYFQVYSGLFLFFFFFFFLR